MVIAADTPIVTNNEMRFFYSGAKATHHETKNRHAIGLATAGRDRLVGLRSSSDEPGYVLTRPMLLPKQGNLFVNAIISANGGTLRAELRDDNNHVIDGYSLEDCDPVTKSGYAQRITWQGKSITSSPRSEVRIRFELIKAQLFTFDIDEN